MKTLSRVLLVWLLGLNPAWAKDIGGQYAVHGVGADTCQHYLAAREQGGGTLLQYEIWLAGYFSAFNLIVSNTYSIMGQRSLEEFWVALDEYCGANPDELFVVAISTVTMVVYPDRQNLSPHVDRWPSLKLEVEEPEVE